jgi:integrase/recombinase XerD
MIILQATQDIRKVSLWLGRATLTTTEICTRGDPTEKLDAMESIVPPHLRRGAFEELPLPDLPIKQVMGDAH